MQQLMIRKKSYLKLSITMLLVPIVVLTFLFAMSSENEALNQIFELSLFLIFFAFVVTRFAIGSALKTFAIGVFSLKIVIVLIYSMNADIIVFPDSYNYITNLNTVIFSGDYSMENLQSIAGTLHVGHYYYMLIPYLIFGTPLSIIYTNTLITSIGILLFYRVLQTVFGNKIALFTFVVSSFSLNLFLFGGAILKESMVIFLIALIFYMVKVRKSRVIIPILLSVLLITVRIYAGVAVLAAVILDVLFINNKRTSLGVKFFSFIGIVILIFGIISLPAAQSYLELSSQYATGLFNLGTITSSITSVLKFYFAPLPWNVLYDFNIYSILIFDTFLFMLLSIFLILFTLKFLRFKELRKKLIIFLVPIIIHAVVLGHTYGGDSTRQRSGIFIFLILTIAVGLFYKNKKDDISKSGA